MSSQLNAESKFWRKLALAGAARGPKSLLRFSPPLIGLFFAVVASQKRRQVRRNLRLILGVRSFFSELLDIARTFISFAHAFADSLATLGGTRHTVSLSTIGDDHLVEALREGHGLVLLTAHTSGWETALHLLRKDHASAVMMVMQGEPDEKARAFHDDIRIKSGLEIVHIGDGPFSSLALLAHLRKGGVVAMQMDRCPDSIRFCEARAFGSNFRIPEGPLALAEASGAPIICAFSRRISFLNYLVEVHAPMRLARRSGSQGRQVSAQQVAQCFEAFVRRFPTEWFHFIP